MEHLLFLVHRIPFPPNKGDKIRSFHLLKHLAQRYHVHLATFIDDADDWQHVDTVRQYCGETHFVKLNPLTAKLRSVRAFGAGRPLSLDYYDDRGMHAWVRALMLRQPISRVLVFSSSMAQYATEPQTRRVIDFVDIDSDKWAQYAVKKSWPMSAVYRREAQAMLRYERQVASEFDASLFVSHAEAALFKTMAPESAQRIDHFSNGVDTDYFSPEHVFPTPYTTADPVIVFTGAMDYWPNIDAVQWFAQEILPAVRAGHPTAQFYIVGSRPSPQVQELATRPGVTVTGSVPDVRPFLAHASLSVAPLRIARGIQNKVLEAMAAAKTVIVSPQALEGIDAVPGSELILADGAQAFIDAVLAQLAQPDPALGQAARGKVVGTFGWDSHLAKVDSLLEHTAALAPTLPSPAKELA
ncbi:MAG: TIGR03087 family PEP-CTERM/XrtA system glycosyltransferase [Pseudomonadota bacterium]